MENVRKSELDLKEILVQKSYFEQKPIKKGGDFKISIEPMGMIDYKECQFQIDLHVKISEASERFIAEIHMVSIFAFNKEIDREILENFIYVNAPAIIFPYVRTYISGITALSGMETIHIPPVNMIGIGEQLKGKLVIKE